MSWNPHMEVHYSNISYPYNTGGSFIEYFEGLTYEHANFIFSSASHAQESSYPLTSSFYKFGHGYDVNHHESPVNDYKQPLENTSITNEQMTATSTQWEESVNTDREDSSIECQRRHHSNSNDFQVIWQDNIDPDDMTYEVLFSIKCVVNASEIRSPTKHCSYVNISELLELGEAVGTQSRGLTQEQISLLPVSKYKCGFFLRKKSRDERCVICQMKYKRGEKLITLPCKHIYHASCGNKWLSINKACPICYREVFADNSKHK